MAAEYGRHIPQRKKPMFEFGPLKISPLTAMIAAVVVTTLITGGLVLASSGPKGPRSSEASSKPPALPRLLPKTSGSTSSAQVPESGEAPVSTREVKTSAGTLVIERVKASDQFLECSSTGRCTQRAGGKFILGITLRSLEGKGAVELQRALSQEALSSYVKTPQGNRVEAFNFDSSPGKTSITVIYAYMDAGITNGLVLFWKGNPPIAIQSGGGGSPPNESSSDGNGARPGSSGGADDEPFVEEPLPSDEEPPPEELPPGEEPPPDEPPPEEPPPEEEPPPDEEPPPE